MPTDKRNPEDYERIVNFAIRATKNGRDWVHIKKVCGVDKRFGIKVLKHFDAHKDYLAAVAEWKAKLKDIEAEADYEHHLAMAEARKRRINKVDAETTGALLSDPPVVRLRKRKTPKPYKKRQPKPVTLEQISLLEHAIALRKTGTPWAKIKAELGKSRGSIYYIAERLERSDELASLGGRRENLFNAGDIIGGKRLIEQIESGKWKAACDRCGAEKVYGKNYLAQCTDDSYCTKCSPSHMSPPPNRAEPEDIVGKTFGTWKVLEQWRRTGNTTSKCRVKCTKCDREYVRQISSVKRSKGVGCKACYSKVFSRSVKAGIAAAVADTKK